VDTTPLPQNATCPECGAELVPGAKKCWLCALRADATTTPPRDASGTGGEAAAPMNPYASPAPPSGHLDRTFSLTSMFLWTTLVAVVMGVASFAPGLGIMLAVLSLPAAARTIGTVYRRKQRRGGSIGAAEKIETFIASFGIVLAIVIGAVTAFTAVCFPLGLASFASDMGGLVIFAIVAGIVAAVFVAIVLARRLWRLGR
jgi:hypothetical protein